MDKKTKEKLTRAVDRYFFLENKLEKQIGNKFHKIPQKYFWIFGLVVSVIYFFNTNQNNPNFTHLDQLSQVIIFLIGSVLMSLIFTGIAIFAVGFVILLTIVTPMINNKIKEAKIMFVDYPKLLREGSFNDNTVEIVKSYLRIVFKEELEVIRDTLHKENKEEMKKITDVANRGFQDQKSEIETLKIQVKSLMDDKKQSSKVESELRNALTKIFKLETEIKKLKGE